MFGWLLSFLGTVLSYVFSPKLLAVVAILLTAGYFYITRRKNYWANRGVRHLPFKFPFGFGGLNFFSEHFNDIIGKIYKEAKEAGGYLPMFDTAGVGVAVTDPEIIKHVMVKDFEVFPDRAPPSMKVNEGYLGKMMTSLSGEEWKYIRTLSTPAFSTGKIRLMSKPCIKQAEALAEQMYRECEEAGGAIEMRQILARYTMDNIASVAFAQEADTIHNPKNMVSEMAKRMTKQAGGLGIMLFLLATNLPTAIKEYLQIARLVFDTHAAEYFARTIKGAIRQRTDNPELRRNDYLQMLLDTRAEGSSKRQLTDDEIVAQCVLFYFAGYDTTSRALTWAVRCLAHNPDVQRRLQADIDNRLPAEAVITFDMVNDMVYLDNMLSETLRLYPIIQNSRSAEREYRLPGTDLKIEPNTTVYMYPYHMHHDPEYWPDPEKFDPDRFLPENKAQRHPYVYMPFGHGPRNCIGMRFALLECKLAIVAILRHYNLVPGEKSSNPQPTFAKSGHLQEKDGTWVKLEKRIQ